MINKDYQPGIKVEVMVDDVWSPGVVVDNLSIQYCVALKSGHEVFVFKKSTDLIRSVK